MVVGERKPVYKIRSCEGHVLVVEDWLIQKSKCFSLVFSFMKDSAQPLQTTVSSYILEKVIEWCHYHRHDEEDQDFREISAWDAQYLQDNNEIILLLIEAAYRLEIRGLLDIACRAVAIMSRRTIGEVKRILRVGGLDGDFNEEEEGEDVEEDLEEGEEDDDGLPAISAA